MENIIEIKKLPSGCTAITMETKTGLAFEVGSGCIFLSADDVYMFIRLLKAVDAHILRKE